MSSSWGNICFVLRALQISALDCEVVVVFLSFCSPVVSRFYYVMKCIC